MANDWLEDAQEFLHLARNGLDVENSEENLRHHMEFFSTESQFSDHLKELQGLVSEIEPYVRATAKVQLMQNVAALEEKAKEAKQEAKTQQERLQRYSDLFFFFNLFFHFKISLLVMKERNHNIYKITTGFSKVCATDERNGYWDSELLNSLFSSAAG